MAFVRKCEKCGNLDARESWSSPTEAADKGAFQNWTCPTCAWTEFDLVEASETGAEAQRDALTPAAPHVALRPFSGAAPRYGASDPRGVRPNEPARNAAGTDAGLHRPR